VLKFLVLMSAVVFTSTATSASVDLDMFETRSALQVLAIQRMCTEAHPESASQVEKNLNADSSMPPTIKAKMKAFRTATDPYIKGIVEGAYIMAFDKDMLDATCDAFSKPLK
jgi:hypothetical protein